VSPLFLSPHGHHGKAWEAAREGIEDYQYFKMLKTLSDQLAGGYPGHTLVSQAGRSGYPIAVAVLVWVNHLSAGGQRQPPPVDQARLGTRGRGSNKSRRVWPRGHGYPG